MTTMNSDRAASTLPLVSVIIPAYNAEAFIEKTLKSVLSQTYQNLEVLVVDDGSQDRTPEIIKSIAQHDKRVIVLHQKNAGVAAARNLGIETSQGEFIAPIDADDIWYPENLEKQVQCFLESDPSVGLVYSWSVDIDQDDVPTGIFRAAKIEGEVYVTLVCHNFIGNASSSMIHRDCFEQIGGYNCQFKEQDAQGCEDWDLYLSIAEVYQFRVVPEFLVGYRKMTNSMSRDYTKMAKSHTLVMQSVRQKHPEIRTAIYGFSSSSLYIYFAHQSYSSKDHKTTLFWLYKAIQFDLITPWIRPSVYLLILKSMLGLFLKLHIPRYDWEKNQSPNIKEIITLEDIKNKKMAIKFKEVISKIFHYVIPKLAQTPKLNVKPENSKKSAWN
ncbi:MAG: glycosyltransferase family A protein [Coleofasciculus sp. D1-CHI-01]|uniref:glycosyltransferase family 2 protein n=1 Tax=Coleofasciculus sp. D1-CHI-01 TaxID=3068482 RepID=UPI0032F3FD7D